jgi:hypothetical protein
LHSDKKCGIINENPHGYCADNIHGNAAAPENPLNIAISGRSKTE